MAKQLPKTMKAVGFYKYLPISDPNSLIDLVVNVPKVENNEVLIEVKAAAVNPIDTKIRAPKPNVETSPRILGWDGSGIVVSKGAEVKLFNIGVEVFFIGDIRKNGANAQYVSLNEILVGKKPKNLSFEEAAAMPIVSLTAYESLYYRLLLSNKDKGKSILIINSAGGVGSVASQLANNLGLKVIGTAQTQEFSLKYGAHIVLNHKQDLIPQLKENGFPDGVDYILVNYDPYPYWNTIMNVVKPQGKICLIVDSSGLVDIKLLKDKSLTLVSEMMQTKIKYNTEDVFKYHEMLEEISKMLDNGQLKHTLTKVMSPINAENLRAAHKIMENQTMLIAPKIQRNDTFMREAIPARVKLEITLAYLASGISYGMLSVFFRLSKTDISNLIVEVCDVVSESLKEYIKVPNLQEWKEIEVGFDKNFNFPGCCGAIDGKHITIQAPPNSRSEHYNYKETNSIILLAVVDHNY